MFFFINIINLFLVLVEGPGGLHPPTPPQIFFWTIGKIFLPVLPEVVIFFLIPIGSWHHRESLHKISSRGANRK